MTYLFKDFYKEIIVRNPKKLGYSGLRGLGGLGLGGTGGLWLRVLAVRGFVLFFRAWKGS